MTWVIAHRGASADERENTLPAFERAIGVGADFVELDVQVSADGALVVFHDVDLDRLTPLRGPLRKRPLAELREHAIPTLDDVLEVTRGRIGVMAELKSPHLYRGRGLVERVAAALGPDDVAVSFQRRALLETKRLRPDLRVLQHVGLGVSIRAASSYAWGVGFWEPRVTGRGLGKARKLGLVTTVYTVNEPGRMRELGALGVDGIFSDRPALLRETLRRGGRPLEAEELRARGGETQAHPRADG
jgi:glycerophosphoryl diester phosphodiesterase